MIKMKLINWFCLGFVFVQRGHCQKEGLHLLHVNQNSYNSGSKNHEPTPGQTTTIPEATTTTPPTTAPTATCENAYGDDYCIRRSSKRKCKRQGFFLKCRKTCDACDKCFNLPRFTCIKPKQCNKRKYLYKCLQSCGECNSVVTTVQPTSSSECPEFTPESCGLTYVQFSTSRIVGGQQATPGEAPFMVSIQDKRGNHFCGGTLIYGEWVLTAAHCVYDAINSEIVVYLGKHTRENGDATEIERKVMEIIIHENYNEYTLNNDIALLRLTNCARKTDYINTACLPAKDNTTPVGLLRVYGWGTTTYKGTLAETLMEVEVPALTAAQCKKSYGTYITKNMFCAGYSEGGKDSCQGDSGGPIVKWKNDRWEVVGIVSWGYGCAFPGSPGVYTKLSRYVYWIEEQVKNS